MAIEREQLVTAFSGLSVLTRQMVIGELDRAMQDTSIEYHRQTTRELQVKLAYEVESLKVILECARKADEEFKEISGESGRRDSTTQQGFRTSGRGSSSLADRIDREISHDEPLPDAEGPDADGS
jgi:hypothetical protein